MKKLFIIAAALISLSVAANEEDSKSSKCGAIDELARTIMKNRQYGVPMRTMMEVSKEDYAKILIEIAYEKPRFSTPEYKDQAVNDFGNEVYLLCVKQG